MIRISGSRVLATVAQRHSLTVSGLQGRRRARVIAWPRHEAMYEIFVQCPHLSYPAIGKLLGGRDHTTVLHGVRKHCERIGVTYEDAKALRQCALTPAVFGAFGEAMRRAA